MEIIEKHKFPFKTLHIDLFGPLNKTEDNYKYILVIIDAFTKFVWSYPVKPTRTDKITNNLKYLFDIFENPYKIISDKGTTYTSGNFSEFLKEREIKHVKTAIASLWANGQVERFNSKSTGF